MSIYKEMFDNIAKKNPIVHHITNYVTVNDCANITLAIGASPIMSANIDEMEEIISISSSLVANIGTMDKVEALKKAPILANEKSVKVVLDPVGVGASVARNKLVNSILHSSKINVIKGNISEILSIAKNANDTKGVDASDIHKDIKIKDISIIAMELAKKLDTVIVVTGKIDVIANSENVYIVKNGVSWMSKITGSGCMSASLIASFIGANEDDFMSTVVAISCMGIAGQLAYECAKDKGTGSFRVALIDNISKMNTQIFEKYKNIEKII